MQPLGKTYVRLCVSENEDINTFSSIYDKGFLVKLDKSVISLVRMELPDELAGSEIFRTGIDKVVEVEQQ